MQFSRIAPGKCGGKVRRIQRTWRRLYLWSASGLGSAPSFDCTVKLYCSRN